MDARQLYDALRKSQEKKGYFFHPDRERTLDLLNGLLVNRQRYGYMSCPCRLARDDLQADRDILCPCAYREADIREFSSCYCGLYVTREVFDGQAVPRYVPERRPAEKG